MPKQPSHWKSCSRASSLLAVRFPRVKRRRTTRSCKMVEKRMLFCVTLHMLLFNFLYQNNSTQNVFGWFFLLNIWMKRYLLASDTVWLIYLVLCRISIYSVLQTKYQTLVQTSCNKCVPLRELSPIGSIGWKAVSGKDGTGGLSSHECHESTYGFMNKMPENNKTYAIYSDTKWENYFLEAGTRKSCLNWYWSK